MTSSPHGASPSTSEDPARSANHDDPLAADRRVMVIALVATIVLVAVGVTSAAVFTRSACAELEPTPIAERVAGSDVDATLAGAFPDASAGDVASMSGIVTDLAGSLGPVTGIADVGGAERLAVMDDATGIAAVGPTTTVLDTSGSRVLATADIGEFPTVVGSGVPLYSLALVNDLTGQVDAFLPLDDQLAGLTCVDTATVGTQLAFHLDAGGGELLLLRVDEDGEDPQVELRDPVTGRVWATYVELGRAPAGVMGERISGALGTSSAVIGGRTAPGAEEPVVTAVVRADGEILWSTSRADLREVLGDDLRWVDVVAVTDDVVVVVVSPEEDRGRGVLVGLDGSDGSLAWTADAEAPVRVLDAEEAPRGLRLVTEGPGGLAYAELAPDDGTYEPRTESAAATSGAVAVTDPRRSVFVTDTGITVVDDRSVASFASPFVGMDVAAHEGGVSLLLGGPGTGAVMVTFGG